MSSMSFLQGPNADAYYALWVKMSSPDWNPLEGYVEEEASYHGTGAVMTNDIPENISKTEIIEVLQGLYDLELSYASQAGPRCSGCHVPMGYHDYLLYPKVPHRHYCIVERAEKLLKKLE